MPFGEVVPVYSKNNVEHINVFCWKDAEFELC
jgi:hypothetical protein